MGILINIQVLPPNQSLKLTEVAVDDFARAADIAFPLKIFWRAAKS